VTGARGSMSKRSSTTRCPTPRRARRDEWIDAGVFMQVHTEALGAFDRIIDLGLDDVAVDGSLAQGALRRGGHRPQPTDRP